jgi:diadenylate cyclase
MTIADILHWTSFSWQIIGSILDIFFVSALIYTVILLVRGTRGQTMLLGLGIIGFVYVLSRELSLITLSWILGNFLGSVILVVVVLFQDDLRRGLIKIGLVPGFGTGLPQAIETTISEISKAAYELSNRKLGALIVIRRDIGLEEYLEHSVKLDALVSYQLLLSIFLKNSPMHDGAVIIERERIAGAGAVLPLTFNPSLGRDYGTRHRAALGLSEHTDAIVVVVSEETGSISVVREGRLTSDFDEKTLYNALRRLTILREKRRMKAKRSYWSLLTSQKESSSVEGNDARGGAD